MDSLFKRDRHTILDALVKKTAITLPVERQIEVLSVILESADPNAPPKIREAHEMCRKYLETLQKSLELRVPVKGQTLQTIDPRTLRDDHLKRGIVRDLDDHELEEFAENIKWVGIIHPPVVTPDLKILAGRQRTKAAIKAGFDEMPVIVRDAPTKEEQLAIAVSEDLYHRNPSPKETFNCYRVICGLNRIWTVEAENLIPQLKSIIADPEVQTFLAPLPQQTQEKLYKFLGEKIEQVSTAAARKDTLETASLREHCAKAEDEIEQLESLISELKAEKRTLAEEKERVSEGASQTKREKDKRISGLEWEIRNLNETLHRLEGEKKNLLTANTELQAKYERIALGKIEREAKVIEKQVMPEDYQELKREIERVKATNKCLEAFWANRRALLGAIAENERVMEGMDAHYDTVKDEITELIEAFGKIRERLEGLVKRGNT